MTSSSQKTASLLWAQGPKSMDEVQSLYLPTRPFQKPFQRSTKILLHHFDPIFLRTALIFPSRQSKERQDQFSLTKTPILVLLMEQVEEYHVESATECQVQVTRLAIKLISGKRAPSQVKTRNLRTSVQVAAYGNCAEDGGGQEVAKIGGSPYRRKLDIGKERIPLLPTQIHSNNLIVPLPVRRMKPLMGRVTRRQALSSWCEPLSNQYRTSAKDWMDACLGYDAVG